MIASLVFYPLFSEGLAAFLDAAALEVIKGDVSQFMQNFFNFNGLLFSFFASQTYTFLYNQQESLYIALYAEVSEARSLVEQITLISQGRPNYKMMLRSMQDYVNELLLGVRFGCPPAVLVSAKPASDPLENILYLTSVGEPSVVYDTVRSLRQARGNRLGSAQRKLPQEHFVLLNALAALELLAFPLLGAGISTYEPGAAAVGLGHVLWLQAVVFALLVGGVVLTLEVVQDLRSPTAGLYSLDEVLIDIVDGLGRELDRRLAAAPRLEGAAEEVDAAALGVNLPFPMRQSPRYEAGEVALEQASVWRSFEPRGDSEAQPRKLQLVLLAGLVASLCFPVLVGVLEAGLSAEALRSVREDNNAQWLQNFFTGIGFIFSLFTAQTFGFLYAQQEKLYLALYAEVSEAKALLEQLTLVCRARPLYPEMLRGLQAYVRDDLERIDRPPAQLLTLDPLKDPLESVLYMTSVGVPSHVYDTVKGLRQARGARLGATQQKLPPAHFVLLAVLGLLELSVFPLLSAGCSALDERAYLPGHIMLFHAALFGLMTTSVASTLVVLLDLWNPGGESYSVRTVLEEMVSGLQEELALRIPPATRQSAPNR